MLAAQIELLQSGQTRMTADGQEQALSGQWLTGSNRCDAVIANVKTFRT